MVSVAASEGSLPPTTPGDAADTTVGGGDRGKTLLRGERSCRHFGRRALQKKTAAVPRDHNCVGPGEESWGEPTSFRGPSSSQRKFSNR
jgi:hypothetical protein